MSLNKRFFALDLVKVLAIVWICVYHLLDFHEGWQLGSFYGGGDYWRYFSSTNGFFSALFKLFISLGVIGVNLFVIASAFGLALSSNKKSISYWQFMKKRVLRIMPFYWIVLIGLFLLNLIRNLPVNYFDYFVHFFGINNFFSEYVLTISAPFWFVSTILQLYLLFPFLFKFSKKIHPILLILFAILMKSYVDPLVVDFFGGGRFFTEYIIDFVLGIVLGNYFAKRDIKSLNKKYLLFIMPILFSFIIISFVNLYSHLATILPLIYQFSAILIFLFLFSLINLLPSKALPFVARASSLSFAVFLVHYPIITKLLTRINFEMPFIFESVIAVVIFFIAALFLEWFLNAVKALFNSPFLKKGTSPK